MDNENVIYIGNIIAYVIIKHYTLFDKSNFKYLTNYILGKIIIKTLRVFNQITYKITTIITIQQYSNTTNNNNNNTIIFIQIICDRSFFSCQFHKQIYIKLILTFDKHIFHNVLRKIYYTKI